jgi:purine-binding chemotaxis protein CheW
MESRAAARGDADEAGEQRQHLTFLVGAEPYAIDILHIKEIREYDNVSMVPMVPPFIRGVINLRGRVVPVLDLAVRFGRKPSAVSKRTCVVITEIENAGQTQDVGIVVDAVNRILEIPTRDVEPPPAFGAQVRTDFISGMARVDGRFIIILALDKILSADEMTRVMALADGAPAEAQA